MIGTISTGGDPNPSINSARSHPKVCAIRFLLTIPDFIGIIMKSSRTVCNLPRWPPCGDVNRTGPRFADGSAIGE